MTDLPSSLGIEAVECVSEGGRTLTVRVTGRWRRRRPELRGQPMLVVETTEGRQRFLAMPEPPSLTGAAPGTWRMTFSVPAALAALLPGRTFLQLGGVMVPLPIGEVEIVAEGPPTDTADGRPPPAPDPGAEVARRRATELAAEVERLERELAKARDQAERNRESIADRDRRLRAAEQHVHAERALRAEVEQELARQNRLAQHEETVLHERVAELERELTRMRRVVDEAQHLAAAAGAARAEAERRGTGPAPAPRVDPSRAPLARHELALHRSARRPGAHADSPVPVQRAGDRAALRLEAAMGRRRDELVDSRLAPLEAKLRAAHEETEAQRRRTVRAYEAIEQVRTELRQLGMGAQAPPPPAAAPVQFVHPPAPATPVRAERLTEALARLRERTPPEPADPEEPVEPALSADSAPPDDPSAQAADPLAQAEPADPSAEAAPPAPARPAKPWLEQPFRALAKSDAATAGRLLLALLPAQRAADPQAVAYDLVLGDLVCARVTVGSGTIHFELAATARPATEVDFQVVGDLARVARLLLAGRLRRRLPSRRRARIRGDRRRVAALDHLVAARLTLEELIGAGLKLDPLLTLTLAGRAIDASWTAGERFTLAHRDPAGSAPGAYLQVRDARAPLASTDPPHGPVTTVVVCPPDDLLGVLAGREGRLEGDARPMEVLRQWLDRAQCG